MSVQLLWVLGSKRYPGNVVSGKKVNMMTINLLNDLDLCSNIRKDLYDLWPVDYS